jgi:hypothetical protein
MLAGNYNMVCEQGTTYTRRFELQYPDETDPTIYYPWDLSGYTARMQVRRTIESSSAMITLTTENGGIDIDEENGAVTVQMTAAQTSSITNSGVYDIELINGSLDVSRLVQGEFILSYEVTR